MKNVTVDETLYDNLTKLGNEKYLCNHYYDYMNSHKDSKYIMFDLTSFKKINDTYGHKVGDKCLTIFADKLRNYFKDSLHIRLHGDEFVVITNIKEEAINKILKLIDFSINNEVSSETIPLKFGFNAGSANCQSDIQITADKADYMMYYAKKNKKYYQGYNGDIYQLKVDEINMKKGFNNKLVNESFSYYGRNLYDIDGNEKPLIQIYTKDIEGNSFLNSKLYSAIRKTTEITKLDLYNLQNVIEKVSMIEDQNLYFLNIDYKSLMSINELSTFFELIKESTISGLENIVVSIDVTGIESSEYGITLDIINILHNHGIKIALDKIDSKVADYLLFKANPSYLKVASSWKKCMNDSRMTKLLESKVNIYDLINEDAKVIFDRVENSIENEYLKQICPDDTLLSGDYYSKEKKLVLR